MTNEIQQADLPTSLAHGAPLSSASWADFVARLRHDCVGKGVHDHCTADAIFKVEARVIIYGIDRDYTDKQAVICDGSTWFSPQEYWDDLDDEQQSRLNQVVQQSNECDFLELDERDQWDLLDEIDDHSVVGWDEKWEYVNSHFTKEAAEAFIERKRHDYRKGIRVYVDAQTHCWEYNTIKEAILQGRIEFVPEGWQLAQMLAADPMLEAGEQCNIAPPSTSNKSLLDWAVTSWHEQVAHRPMENVYRRTLDSVWRQVIRFAGEDPQSIIGPSHDDLLQEELKTQGGAV